jgi:hypothetical protein
MNGSSPRVTAAPEIERIDAPYLLALLTVSVYEHGGRRYLDDLWAKDLRRHAEYIADLTLVCYREPIRTWPTTSSTSTPARSWPG